MWHHFLPLLSEFSLRILMPYFAKDDHNYHSLFFTLLHAFFAQQQLSLLVIYSIMACDRRASQNSEYKKHVEHFRSILKCKQKSPLGTNTADSQCLQ